MDMSPHWPLWVTGPLAFFFACALGAYWWRLGLPDVPPKRRRLRRAANVVMGLLTLAMVIGMSIADPIESRGLYITIWITASVLVLALLALAVLDMIHNLKIHAKNECRATAETAKMLQAELDRAADRSGDSARED